MDRLLAALDSPSSWDDGNEEQRRETCIADFQNYDTKKVYLYETIILERGSCSVFRIRLSDILEHTETSRLPF